MLFLVFSAQNCFSKEKDVNIIVKKMKNVFEPSVTTTRMVTFTLKDRDGETSQWTGREARKNLPDGKKSLLVMLDPQEIVGTARLICEKEGKNERTCFSIFRQWIEYGKYIPSMRTILL